MSLLNSKFEKFDAHSLKLDEADIQLYLAEISGWQVVEASGIETLSCSFRTKKYSLSLAFTNKIAALAESVNHHPVITLEYASVQVVWWSHEMKGLHKNDFIMAAKTSQLFNELAE